MEEPKKEIADKDGANMVIFLQSMVGIVETEQSALKVWKSFNEFEREKTQTVYQMLSKNLH